jgi:hypothetical protein
MTEPLLKTHLEPVAQRHRKWRRARGLACLWGACAAVSVLLLATRTSLGAAYSLLMPALLGVAAIGTMVIWRRHGRWEPDYRAIARQIEQRHPDLHALLLTALEQRPDPVTGSLNYLQERVVSEAVAESRRHQHEWLETVSSGRLLAVRCTQLAALALLV